MLGLHHIVLYCADTDTSRAWYAAVGFEYLRGYHSMHWFKLGQTEIMLHPTDSRPAGPTRIGLHVAVKDVDTLFAQVVEQGLTPHDHQGAGQPMTGPVTRPWGDREFELIDPDGYTWAFTQTPTR